jgi:hypothetical protein
MKNICHLVIAAQSTSLLQAYRTWSSNFECLGPML